MSTDEGEMPIEWIENKQASRPQHMLFINGDRICTVSQRKDMSSLLEYWAYSEPGCESVAMDAFDLHSAKQEAVVMVKQKLRAMFDALEALK